MLIVAIGTALFGLTDGLALQLAALLFFGLGFAPTLSALYFMVSREIDEQSATEAFGWLNSGALVGGALVARTVGPLHGRVDAIPVRSESCTTS